LLPARHSRCTTTRERDGRVLLRCVMLKTLREYRAFKQSEGAIGYILLWAMGVPASLLFLIFLVRGCN
jgi:hypothetical protein